MVDWGDVDYLTLLTIISDIQRSINNRPSLWKEDWKRWDLTGFWGLMRIRSCCWTWMIGIFLPLCKPSGRGLLRTMQVRNQSLEKFRALWLDEYLLNLKERPRFPLGGISEQTKDWVIVKSYLKPRPFWVLEIFPKVINRGDCVVRLAKVKQGVVQCRSTPWRNWFLLSCQIGDQIGVMPLSTDVPAADHTPVPPQATPSEEGKVVWFCPAFNAPQGDQAMIFRDRYDDWRHFGCVGIESSILQN